MPWPGCARITGTGAIDVEVMTTDLTIGQPFRLPFDINVIRFCLAALPDTSRPQSWTPSAPTSCRTAMPTVRGPHDLPAPSEATVAALPGRSALGGGGRPAEHP
jgi:hypothetical protein